MFNFLKKGNCERIDNLLERNIFTRLLLSHTCLAFCYGIFLFAYELKFLREIVPAIHPVLIGWAGLLAAYDVLIRRIWNKIPFWKPLLLFMISALITAVLNRETGLVGNIKAWILVVLPLFAFLPVCLLKDKQKLLKTFITALLGVAVIACVASAASVIMYINRVNQTVTFMGITDTVGFRYYYAGGPSSAIIVYGIYADTNHASLYALSMIAYGVILLCFCLKCGYAHKWKNVMGGIFAAVSILVQICYFPLANSRGSWLSMGVAVLLCGFLYLYSCVFKKSGAALRCCASLLLACVVLGVFCLSFLGARDAMTAATVGLENYRAAAQAQSEGPLDPEMQAATEVPQNMEMQTATETPLGTEKQTATEVSGEPEKPQVEQEMNGNLSVMVSADCKTMELVLTDTGNVERVWFPVWSEINGQDDIQWYEAEKQENGCFRYSVDLTVHGDAGVYFVHCYGGTDQPEQQLATTTAEVLEVPYAYLGEASGFSATLSHGYTMLELVLKDAGGYENVWFAVWSINNDQDDLLWYPAHHLADGTFTAAADMTMHGEAGIYAIHVYGGAVQQEELLLITDIELPIAPISAETPHNFNPDTFTKHNADFGAGRIEIWKDTLKLFSFKPIMGQGPGNVSYYAAMYSPDGVIAGGKVDVHNSYLDVLLDYGIVGFALLMSFWVLCIVRVIRSVFVEKQIFDLNFYLCAFVIIVTACGAFLLSCTFINTTAMYFLMLVSTSYLLAESQTK